MAKLHLLTALLTALLLCTSDAGRIGSRWSKNGKVNINKVKQRLRVPKYVRPLAKATGVPVSKASITASYSCTLAATLASTQGDESTKGFIVLLVFSSDSGYNVGILGSFSSPLSGPPNNTAIFSTSDTTSEVANLDSIMYTNLTDVYESIVSVVVQQIPNLAGYLPDANYYSGTSVWLNTDQLAGSADNTTLTDTLNDIIGAPDSYIARVIADENVVEGVFKLYSKAG